MGRKVRSGRDRCENATTVKGKVNAGWVWKWKWTFLAGIGKGENGNKRDGGEVTVTQHSDKTKKNLQGKPKVEPWQRVAPTLGALKGGATTIFTCSAKNTIKQIRKQKTRICWQKRQGLEHVGVENLIREYYQRREKARGPVNGGPRYWDRGQTNQERTTEIRRGGRKHGEPHG